MAVPTTFDGMQLFIKIGDGGSPSETFTHNCLINTDRGVEFSSDTNEVMIPDCADLTLPRLIELFVLSNKVQVTGSGVLPSASISTFSAWKLAGTSKNVQIWLGTTGYWQMAMKCTNWNVNGSFGEKVNTEVTLMSHGAIGAWTTP